MYKYNENSSMKNRPFSLLFLIVAIIGGFVLAFFIKEEKVFLLIDLAVIVVCIMSLLIWKFKNKANKLMANEEEILFEVGLLSKTRSEINTSGVRTVKITQSFIERIFGIGTIEIYTSGDLPEVIAKAMPNPHKFRELIKN